MQTLYKYANNYHTVKMVMLKEGRVNFGYLDRKPNITRLVIENNSALGKPLIFYDICNFRWRHK
jgi:hypothetical protein